MLTKNYSTIDQTQSKVISAIDRQNKSTLDMYRTGKLSNFSAARPQTSFLLVHRLNTASQPRSVQFADQTEIDTVEHDLQAAYKVDLNGYLHKKFRNFLIRKHEPTPPKLTFLTLENPQMMNTFCSKMQVSMMFDEKDRTLSQKRPERAIQTAYLLNAKQRITRLVQRKRERQTSFSNLKKTLRQKCKKKEKNYKRIGPHELNTIQDRMLNQRLKNQFQHQIERYKERVLSKVRSMGKDQRPKNIE